MIHVEWPVIIICNYKSQFPEATEIKMYYLDYIEELIIGWASHCYSYAENYYPPLHCEVHVNRTIKHIPVRHAIFL